MIRSTTTRGSLGLYGALLVLPTLVFGWLYWRELLKDYQEQLEAVPATAKDGARRIAAGMKDTLDKLLEAESRRPFYQYGRLFSPEDAVGDELALQTSPLVKLRAPRGVLGWFNFDRKDGAQGPIQLFVGRGRLGEEEELLRADLAPAVERFRARKLAEGRLQELAQLDEVEPERLPLRAIAIHLGQERDLECVKRCSPLLRGLEVSTGVSRFHLDFYVEEDGTPRAVASRRVLSQEGLTDLPQEAECLRPLVRGFALQQGFFLDVDWLFQELPFFIAGQALGENEELISAPGALSYDKIDTVFADILPARDLGFSAALAEQLAYGKLEVSIDTDHIEERYLSHLRRFLGVALMLVLSLATGFTLLYKSVQRELEQARRTQNFVASVTHELRTPLSTIQLHGEMLLDGWVDDPDKRSEYYRRIVRETKRLSTLVERVLEKSQLKERSTAPEAGDLNSAILRLRPSLVDASETADLVFDLAPGLPLVWLTPEGVAGILGNLVENARKYAPVPAQGEPIRVATRLEGQRVLLEVADRGPGVPAEERDKIFEAFYRMGSEATRTTTGTGLGLHLVRLHADVAGARATVHARDGGGSVFRVAYRVADERTASERPPGPAVKVS